MGSLLRNHWNRFIVGATALASQFAPFVQEPPSGTWLPAAGRFFLALLLALWFVPTLWFGRRRHARAWWLMALVTAAAAIVLVFSYGSRLGRWTVEYSKGGRVVIGQTLTQDARNYTQGRRERGEPPLNDRALLRYYGREQVKEVWLAEEIEHRQESLDRMYLLTILALGSGVVCASQACFCATRRQ